MPSRYVKGNSNKKRQTLLHETKPANSKRTTTNQRYYILIYNH